MKHSLKLAVLASVPASLAGAWSIGTHVASAQGAGLWQLELLEWLGVDVRISGPQGLLIGAVFLVPLLLVCAAASRLWAELFARARSRPLDPGWFHSAWLFVLLLPATMPLHYAALGISVGVLFGSHVFGGAGRQVVSPALLGALFLTLAYPDLVATDRWVPGATMPATWSAIAAGMGTAAETATSWWPAFLGREVGALGTTSAFACLVGGAFLALRGAADWRVLAGALLGLVMTSELDSTLPWHWHLALGSFAFAAAFIATDPSVRPTTKVGAWAFGALFGALAVVLRVANPEHPEGTLAALLLAMLCLPLLDEIVRAAQVWRHRTAGADR